MKPGLAAACSAVLILVLGMIVFALRGAPDTRSVDGTPVAAGAVPNSKGPVKTHRSPNVDVQAPDPSIEDSIGIQNILPDSDEGRWNHGVVVDTGPFIDADDDAGDYSFSPVSDVGDFLDPEAD